MAVMTKQEDIAFWFEQLAENESKQAELTRMYRIEGKLSLEEMWTLVKTIDETSLFVSFLANALDRIDDESPKHKLKKILHRK